MKDKLSHNEDSDGPVLKASLEIINKVRYAGMTNALGTRSESGGGGNKWPPIAKPRDGGDNGGMEAKIARLESDMSHISKTLDEVKLDVREIRRDIQDVRKEATRDYRTLFAALITVAIGLAGLMAKGFNWL